MRKISQFPFNFKGKHRFLVLNIINTLSETPRTGFKDRGVEKPESVYEHTERVIDLAKRYFGHIPGLIKMLKIHDWAEHDKKVGDLRTDPYCPKNHRYTREEKFQMELMAMMNICKDLGIPGKEIFELWLEFEEGETEQAKIARQLDKLQAIMQAIYYQNQGQPVAAQEFVDNDGDKITNPVLRKLLEKSIMSLKASV